jgi:hypothetical protein
MIRFATVDDAAAIAAVHVRGWQAAHRGDFPDDYLDGLSVVERAQRWVAWLADPAQATAVYVAPDRITGLWTLESSAGARAFYERCGWSPDGATKCEPLAGWTVAQVRYAWRSPPAV